MNLYIDLNDNPPPGSAENGKGSENPLNLLKVFFADLNMERGVKTAAYTLHIFFLSNLII